MLSAIIIFIASYLLGSVNVAILLFKIFKKRDPRESHSGNAGSVNVYRQAGMTWAIVVLLLDMLRAIGISFVATQVLHQNHIPWAAFFLVLGNRYPCFHSFKGGKGVANYLGFTFYISPLTGLLSCGAWVLVYLFVHVPFIASFFMVGVLASGTVITFYTHPAAISGTLLTTLFIYFNHRGNCADYCTKKREDKEND